MTDCSTRSLRDRGAASVAMPGKLVQKRLRTVLDRREVCRHVPVEGCGADRQLGLVAGGEPEAAELLASSLHRPGRVGGGPAAGMPPPTTLSRPSASAAMAAVTATSIPPESPSTAVAGTTAVGEVPCAHDQRPQGLLEPPAGEGKPGVIGAAVPGTRVNGLTARDTGRGGAGSTSTQKRVGRTARRESELAVAVQNERAAIEDARLATHAIDVDEWQPVSPRD